MTKVRRFRTVEEELLDYITARDDITGAMRRVLDLDLGGMTIGSARRIDALMRSLFPNYPSDRIGPTRR
jgi:hypothetical protein